jgi:hypothetical protein
MIYVKNVPGWERVIRIVVGVAVACVGLVAIKGVAGILLAATAAGLLVSGLIGFCPACSMFGRRIAKKPQDGAL